MFDILVLALSFSGVVATFMAVLGAVQTEGGPVYAVSPMRPLGKPTRLPVG